MNLDLSFYFAVFLRRLPYFILVFALVTAAAIAAALMLPPVYRSSSVLMVEAPQLPSELDAPRVQAEALARLQTIENNLMKRPNLLEIAQKLKVFKGMSSMTPDDIVDSMRAHTTIDKLTGRGEATVMTVTFEAESGPIAAGVVNEYVTLIQNEDVEGRTKSAEGTVDFFEQQRDQLSGQLDLMSAKILDFQNKNSDALPSTLSYRLSQQTNLQERLATVERDIATLKDQRARMVEIFNSTGQVNASNANLTPEARQLEQMKQQLNSMLALLAPENPKVKNLEAQISQLEEVVKGQLPVKGSSDPTATIFEAQLADIDSRMAISEEERKKIVGQLDVLKDSIDRTPANQIALDALNRDYANIQQQYNNTVDNLAKAMAGEKTVVGAKGERVAVVDAATIPDRPFKPNRLFIAIAGVGGGIFMGLATVVLLELLNGAVRRPKDLTKAFGITPIATIPYMRTPSETMARRSGFAALLALAVIGIPALIYAIHVFYAPLDSIVAKLASMVGLRL
ncbi:MAG: hypothetical protein KDE00_01385 [Rhodobacteraceae bacterium]|nr:hypothetical protein [Paracoccaceae bacterium]